MNVLWMAYATLVAGLLGLGAAGAERALRRSGHPTRAAWAFALAASWIVPALALLGVVGGAWGEPAGASAAFVARELTAEEHAALVGSFVSGDPFWQPLLADDVTWVLNGLWCVLTVSALILIGVSAWRLLSRSRGWPAATVAGRSVRLSPDFGPAVLGVLRPTIVLPRWMLELPDGDLEMILRHEIEHQRARDTLLLTAGTVAAIAAPWNAALWWQLRRLRMAVETDCDRRVIRGGAPARAYGELLLDIGSRLGRVAIPAAALAERSSFLERRIRLIANRRPGGRWQRTGGVLVAGAAVLVACRTPAPEPPALSRTAGPAVTFAFEDGEAEIQATAVRGSADPASVSEVWTFEPGDSALTLARGVVSPGAGSYRVSPGVAPIEERPGGGEPSPPGRASGAVTRLSTTTPPGPERRSASAGTIRVIGEVGAGAGPEARLEAVEVTARPTTEGTATARYRAMRLPEDALIYLDGEPFEGSVEDVLPVLLSIDVVRGDAAARRFGPAAEGRQVVNLRTRR